MFSQIHEIVFHGKGGYDYDTVYNFPIWLRNFTFRKIQDHYEKEQEEYDKAKGKQKATKQPKIKKPSYRTKTRK